MKQTDSLTRLKGLLRELFQLDVADLDFGIYRLFHLKRAEVEAFLNEQLPAEVDRAFAAAAGTEREALQKRVDDLAERARASVADDVILPNGEPNPTHASAKAVREYAEARSRLQAVEASEAQRADIFNLLYAFFSRYYDAGDFIPRRFYGAHASYAIPYNGEEVLFHWANKDQHYIKSGEAFRDYAFMVSTVSGVYRVRFKLVEATAPKDNTKGDARFFFPLPKESTFDKATRTFTVPFHYRLPTLAEVVKYGKNTRAQEAILDESAPKVLEAVADEFLRSALAAPSPGDSTAEGEDPPTLLRRRLSHFTKKNTTDYFVHKDLGAFLRQELEFFVRDQVVHEADLEGDFDAKRRTIRVFRKLGGTLITFLAQVEDAQKRLFEKKKFVLRTDYLVPIQNVPRALWPEVLANKAQLAEWKKLYALEAKSDLFNFKGLVNERVLERHPTLVVDTRHFDTGFTALLLAELGDLDEQTDGVLIHGENFQALSFMQERYQEQVKCVYIDPPYNTDASPIVYKNGYRRSSWLALLADGLELDARLRVRPSIRCIAIDDFEYPDLHALLERLSDEVHHATAVVRSKPQGRPTASGFSANHEYSVFWGAPDAEIGRLPRKGSKAQRYPHSDARGIYSWGNMRKSGTDSDRADRRKSYYPIYVAGAAVRVPSMAWREVDEKWEILEKHKDSEVAVWPIDPSGDEKVWTCSAARARAEVSDMRIGRDDEGRVEIYKKYRPNQDGALPGTWWDDPAYSASESGTKVLKELFGAKDFDYPKSVMLVVDCLRVCRTAESDAVLDYFAGSGTTGHAVINLNREDGGRRKFILVEMGDYFQTVLLPRIQKVMFTPEWKDGKPARLPTQEEAERTPRLVKVLRLESYEDALHNTFSDKSVERLAEREKAHREAVGEEEYRVRYLVKLPLEASDSMLNLARLEHPFDYTLEVLTDHGPKTENVDLVETFNWLYGLRVHRLLTWVNDKDAAGKEKDGRSYRVVVGSDREGKKRILVVWRDMTGLDPNVDRLFLEAKAKDIGSFEERWINGDTAARDFASLDGLFKRLMGEGDR